MAVNGRSAAIWPLVYSTLYITQDPCFVVVVKKKKKQDLALNHSKLYTTEKYQ